MPCTCSSPLLSWKCGLRVSICSTGTELAITSGRGALQHPAELLEQVDELVRLDREPAGQPQLQAQVEAHRVLAGVAGGDHLGAEAGVLGEEAVEPLVGDLRAAAAAAEEQPAVAQLAAWSARRSGPSSTGCRPGAARPRRPCSTRAPPRARSCRRPRSRCTGGRSSRPAPCRSAWPRPCRLRTSPASSISSAMPAALTRGGQPGIALVHGDRRSGRPAGRTARRVCASIS